MTTTSYYIEVFSTLADSRTQDLRDAINREVLRLGLHHTVSIELVDAPTSVMDAPVVGVYFGNSAIVDDSGVTELVARSLSLSRVIIPVVDDLASYSSSVPACLRLINGFEWTDRGSWDRLCRKLLEELGVEDRQRRAFISYKRDDGLAAAEQLHDYLSHAGFRPFIDRFHIAQGRDIQAEIADQLEDCAMLILLETPMAHTSDWVFDEVDYSLSHQLGLHIISWPRVETELPGTQRLPRQRVEDTGLTSQRGYDIFTSETLDRIIAAIEAEHARAMVSRRRYLLVSAEEAAQDAGWECLPLPGWRMSVRGHNRNSIVQVTPRLPTVDDMYTLDEFCRSHADAGSGILVHAARRLPPFRRNVLEWARNDRDLSLVPENAIGAYWRSNVAHV